MVKGVSGRVICRKCGFNEDVTLMYDNIETINDMNTQVNDFFEMRGWTILGVPSNDIVNILCQSCFNEIMQYPLGVC